MQQGKGVALQRPCGRQRSRKEGQAAAAVSGTEAAALETALRVARVPSRECSCARCADPPPPPGPVLSGMFFCRCGGRQSSPPRLSQPSASLAISRKNTLHWKNERTLLERPRWGKTHLKEPSAKARSLAEKVSTARSQGASLGRAAGARRHLVRLTRGGPAGGWAPPTPRLLRARARARARRPLPRPPPPRPPPQGALPGP